MKNSICLKIKIYGFLMRVVYFYDVNFFIFFINECSIRFFKIWDSGKLLTITTFIKFC